MSRNIYHLEDMPEEKENEMRMDFSDSINANSEFVRVRPKGPDYWILEPGDIVEVVSTETNKPLAIAMYTEADNVADPYDMYGRNDWLRWIFTTDKAKINRAWRRIRVHENNPCDCNLIGQMLPNSAIAPTWN